MSKSLPIRHGHLQLDLSDDQLFTALARAARGRMSEFNVQMLADEAWAYASGLAVDHSDDFSLEAVAVARSYCTYSAPISATEKGQQWITATAFLWKM